MLSIFMIEALGAEAVLWDLLDDISRLLQQIP